MRSKSNDQIALDLDRFVGRGQSDQMKKNAFDTAVNREKPRNTQHYKISSKCMQRSDAQNLQLLTTKIGQKLHSLHLFYFKNLPFVCHAADGRGIDHLHHM